MSHISNHRQPWYPLFRYVANPRHWLLLSLIGVVISYAIWLLIADPSPLVGNIYQVTVDALVFLLALRTARHPNLHQVARRSWALLTAAFFFLMLGDLSFAYNELVLSAIPLDLTVGWYMLMYGCLVAGVLLFPTPRLHRSEILRFWLDVAMVSIAGLMFSWFFIFQPLLSQPTTSWLDLLTFLLFPVLDMVLLFSVIRILFREPEPFTRRPLQLLSIALGLFVVADWIYNRELAAGNFQSGTWIELFWFVGNICIAIAAQQVWDYATYRYPIKQATGTYRTLFGVLPYLTVVGAYILLLAVGFHDQLAGLIIGSVLLTALVIARQFLLLRENQQLLGQKSDLANQLWTMAYHDSLTGLANRANFQQRLKADLIIARRNQSVVQLLLLDLDGFKHVNDSLGHAIGDQILQMAARRLEHCVTSDDDLICRLGGDEFAIVLSQSHGIEASVELAEAILQAFETTFTIEGHEVSIYTSIGVAISNDERTTADILLRNADMAMYQAKARGKACYAIFEPDMLTTARERLAIENDLARALERNEFILHYQPIVDLQNNACIGFEALLRWEHPWRGRIPPVEFIPLLEETGRMVAVGRWIIRSACQQMSEWRLNPDFANLQFMSVNLSVRQFQDPILVSHIANCLAETKLPAAFLKLEITETATAHNTDQAVETLLALKDIGVQLAIDDFGTGYSVLSYLKHFPVDTIKLDRSFVIGLGKHASDTGLLRAVVAFSQNLEIEVIAEGVETEVQRELLLAMGCKFGQGYLFLPPADPNTLKNWVRPHLIVN